MVNFNTYAVAENANRGAIDSNFLTVRAKASGILTGSKDEYLGFVNLTNCQGFGLYIDFLFDGGATNTILTWYFSDIVIEGAPAVSHLSIFLPCSITIAAGALTLTTLSLSLGATFKGMIHIPNPGTKYVLFWINGGVDPLNSELGIYVIRNGFVNQYIDDT